MLICNLFKTLQEYYGEQHWWPFQSGERWEIITGAILTQNTAWTNVEKAIGNLLGPRHCKIKVNPPEPIQRKRWNKDFNNNNANANA